MYSSRTSAWSNGAKATVGINAYRQGIHQTITYVYPTLTAENSHVPVRVDLQWVGC